MKHIVRIMCLVLLAALVASCGTQGDEPANTADATPDEAPGIRVENAFYYTHVDGHKEEVETPAFVLFEYEQLETVKYQVAYIACTCRGPEVNYWSVAYVEIDKATNSIANISYGEDSSGHYTAGMYGDSIESWDGTPVHDLFFDQFIGDYILGKTEEEIDSYEAMHGSVDAYTGATVTPNNAMRMLQGLFEYHTQRYG